MNCDNATRWTSKQRIQKTSHLHWIIYGKLYTQELFRLCFITTFFCPSLLGKHVRLAIILLYARNKNICPPSSEKVGNLIHSTIRVYGLKSCSGEDFSTFGNQGEIVFVWVSGWISLLYHRVICLHWFKLFPPDMSSFTHMHNTDLLAYTEAHLQTYIHIHGPSPAAPLLWLLV